MTAAEVVLAIIALYPVVTAALWTAGGVLYRVLDEHEADTPSEWPGVSVVVPAYNEEAVIATCVHAILASDYPELELIVLDDGSADDTEAAALAAAADDPRCHVFRDAVNRGKAERLNEGFARASHELVVVTDADTHLHPQAIRLLVRRMLSSPLVAAVAGAPHVTNRGRLLPAMQVLEARACSACSAVTACLRSAATTRGWRPRTSTSPGASSRRAGTPRTSPTRWSACRSR